jgi:ATP-dependent exoDNAse (exonuclease V) alpha subunit
LRQWANLLTREDKTQTPAEYTRYWKDMAKAQGLRVGYALPSDSPPPTTEALAANAFNHLAERRSVFRQPELQAQALLLGCAHHDRKTMEQATQAMANQYGIALERDRITSYQHAASAAYLLEFERQSRDTITPLATQDRLPAILANQEARQGFQYSADQREALAKILTGRDGIMTLVGAAGAGKTTALAAVAKVAQDADLQVIGLAPSHVAKDALAESLGVQANTLAGWLQSPPAAKGPRLIILDESGMVSSSDMAGLFASLGTEDRLLLVGDPKQLSPIAAGQPFSDLLEQRPDTPTLGEIRRQRDAAQRRIATLFSQGEGQQAAQLLLGFAHEVDSEALIQSAASAYLAAPGSKVLLASKRATVDSLNAEISRRIHGDTPPMAALATARKIPATKAERERMSFYPAGRTVARRGEVRRVERVDGDRIVTNRGEIIERPWERGWDACEVAALDLWAGDPLLAVDTFALTIDGKVVKVKNGTELTVVGEAANGGVVLRLPDGRQGATDPRSAIPVQYAYARTVHKSQGQTVDHAIVVDDGMAGASIGYVATSRQRESLTIITSDKASLSDRLADWAQRAPMTATKGSEEKLAAARREGITYAQKQAAPRQQAAAARQAEAERQARIEVERRQAEAEAARQAAAAEAARQAARLAEIEARTNTQTEAAQVEATQTVQWVRRP